MTETDCEDVDDFSLPSGAKFARILDTPEGQILATIETNNDGNACIVFTRWIDDGLAKLTLGVNGARSPATDHIWVENFEQITPERALAAWHKAID